MWVDVTFAGHSPPFILYMQRLRCQAKVKAKALKPHTPGCGACMDVFNIMLTMRCVQNPNESPRFNLKRKKKKMGHSFLEDDILCKDDFMWHLEIFSIYLFIYSFNRCKFVLAVASSCTVYHLVFGRTTLSHPRWPGHLVFLSGSVLSSLISTPASLGLFFLYRPK